MITLRQVLTAALLVSSAATISPNLKLRASDRNKPGQGLCGSGPQTDFNTHYKSLCPDLKTYCNNKAPGAADASQNTTADLKEAASIVLQLIQDNKGNK